MSTQITTEQGVRKERAERAWRSGGNSNSSQPFEGLEGHKYLNLTTFRRSGEAVSTPVWFALVDGCIYVCTDPDSGKMKRIRNNPRVLLTPCNPWGRPRGESVEGVARIVGGEETFEGVSRTLLRKYRLELAVARLFGILGEYGRPNLEIRAAGHEANR